MSELRVLENKVYKYLLNAGFDKEQIKKNYKDSETQNTRFDLVILDYNKNLKAIFQINKDTENLSTELVSFFARYEYLLFYIDYKGSYHTYSYENERITELSEEEFNDMLISLRLKIEQDKTDEEIFRIEKEIEDKTLESEQNPFDPEKIDISQELLSVKYLYELYQDNMIDLSPDFQREFVWKERKRKSLLIESLMLNIPIPAFYIYETEDTKFQIIDGQQRLKTIFDFLDGEYTLNSLEYLGNDYNSKRFEDLPVKIKNRIYRTQLSMNILSPKSPHKIVYDIFKRINTGGKKLNNQEMRNAVSTKIVRDFLNECSDLEEFKLATNNRVKSLRMDNQEFVLRFIAFYNIYDFESSSIEYHYSSLVDLLDETNQNINNNLNDKDTLKFKSIFRNSMANCYRLFGEESFTKLEILDNSIVSNKVINKSLYSAFSVLLANEKYDKIDLEKHRNCVKHVLAKKLEEPFYYDCISSGTNNRSKIESTFKFTKEVLDNCIKI